MKCRIIGKLCVHLHRIDLDGEQTRSPDGEFLGAVACHFVHLTEDVHAAFVSLSQSGLHDFGGDAFDLDVHLQSGHTVFGPATLKSMSPR